MNRHAQSITVVLLPGLDGSGILFEPLLAELDQIFKIHIIRYAPSCDFGYEDLIDEVDLQIKRLIASGEQFLLLGESFSGPIAIALAARKLDGLCGVVLCATFANNPKPTFALSRGLIDYLPLSLVPINNPMVSFLLLGKYATPALRLLLRRGLKPLSASVIRARLKAVLAVDVRTDLLKISVPMLYLQAKDDVLVTASASRIIQALKPQMFVEIFDSAHCLLQIAPVQAAEKIKKFALSIISNSD